MADSFKTVATPGEAIFKEKMSKFIAFARHIENGAEAKAFIAECQKKYHDARHVCWAYMTGVARTDFLSQDNGEPSGTAGKPILGQINSFGLTDVVVVVVRYFGGIKLGTSGLIAAYREAARQALTAATIEERHAMADISFTFPYVAINSVMEVVKTAKADIKARQFDNTCSMTVSIRKDNLTQLRMRLTDTDGVSILSDAP